jgi:hypothetical protein
MREREIIHSSMKLRVGSTTVENATMPLQPDSPVHCQTDTPSVESSLTSTASTSESSASNQTVCPSSEEVVEAAASLAASSSNQGVRPPYRRKKSPRDLLLEARNAAEQSRIYNLTLDINNLQQEIHQLQVYRNLLHGRARRANTKSLADITSILMQYFDGFHHGLRDIESAHGEFVRSIASDQFTIGTTTFGIDMLLEQWRRYTTVFAIRCVTLHESVAVPLESGVMFQCPTEFHGVFTRLAVDTVFPNARTRLWQLLQALGADMICPMLFHLYFDANGQLVRQDLAADFFTAIWNLPGGDTLSFLDGARVGEESMIESPQCVS